MSTKKRESNRKRTVIVASSPCVPARYWALTALKPYQATHRLKTYAQSASKVGKDGLSMIQDEMVIRNVAEVTVPEHRARWVEYLLLCSGHFQLLSHPIDPMNSVWAEGSGYRMPRPWNSQEQLIIAQSECAQRQLDELRQSEGKRPKKNAPERFVDRLVRFVRG